MHLGAMPHGRKIMEKKDEKKDIIDIVAEHCIRITVAATLAGILIVICAVMATQINEIAKLQAEKEAWAARTEGTAESGTDAEDISIDVDAYCTENGDAAHPGWSAEDFLDTGWWPFQ